MFTTPTPPCWLACAKKRSLLLTSTLLLLVLCSFDGSAQTPSKAPTASISGRVTIDGKGAAGITVAATTSSSPLDNRTAAKTTTDDDGKYQLTGLTAGQFTIMPLTKAFVEGISSGVYFQPGRAITVAEGETITKIDFALVRGGVITGRITDTDGRPVIGERVNVVARGAPDNGRPMTMFEGPRNKTDDRGIYRVYGLSPGNYKVSIGQAANAGTVAIMGMGGSQYTKTFYPGVGEEDKATIVEINEGTEVTNIDIVARKSGRGFSVSGRVVDADSGQPVPSVFVVHSSLNEATQAGGMIMPSQTDANGKFRLENVQPGHYATYMLSTGEGTTSYSDQTLFDVSDGDVSGVEIKIHRGATISGVAVVENNSDPAVASVLQTVFLFAFSRTNGGAPSYSRSQISADGRFSFSGLAPGKVQISMIGLPAPPKGLTLVRTEIDGIEQREGIEVNAGAKITGVRLVFAYGTGSIRGEVKAEGGVLPTGLTLQVMIRSATGDARHFGSVDARGQFVVENVPPGTYEVSVMSYGPDHTASTYEPAPRTVHVENGPVQIVLVVNFAAKKAVPE